MLLQEEAVKIALTSAGQFLIPPEDLGITKDRVRDDVFIPAVKRYDSSRPKIIETDVYVRDTLWPLPADFVSIVSVLPVGFGQILANFYIYQQPAPAVPTYNWRLDGHGNLVLPSGSYRVRYQSKYTLAYNLTSSQDFGLLPSGTEGLFTLVHPPRPGTVVLTLGGREVTDDGSGAIDGQFITSGSVDYVTGQISIVPNENLSVIGIRYSSAYPGVVEFGVEERFFLELFTAKFLLAYAMQKSVFNVDQTPTNINLDDLKTFAQDKLNKWEESLHVAANKWYDWGG